MKRLALCAAVCCCAITANVRASRSAKATFLAAPGVALKAEAELSEVAGGVEIKVHVEQGPPGKKGIHIHQRPDCSNIPGNSMGPHVNPFARLHGLPHDTQHQLGDLGNLSIQSDGTGSFKIIVPGANLDANSDRSFVNRALVIHETEDEGTSAAGGRPIACAITRAE